MAYNLIGPTLGRFHIVESLARGGGWQGKKHMTTVGIELLPFRRR